MIQSRDAPSFSASGPSTFEEPDFRHVFLNLPAALMILDTRFVIVAVSDSLCRVSMQPRDALVGRSVFEAFPDNPDDSGADGVARFRNSLLTVIRARVSDEIYEMKYDIRRADGSYEARHWRAVNTPVLGPNGYVRWIITSTENITDNQSTHDAAVAAGKRVQELETSIADLRKVNDSLLERIALLRSSLKALSPN